MQAEDRKWLLISRALSGNIDAGEISELESFFKNEPELRADYEHLKRMRLTLPADAEERKALERNLEKLDASLATEERFVERHLFSRQIAPIASRRSVWWLAAASIAVIAMAGLVTLRRDNTTPILKPQRLATYNGKRVHAVLPDGSSVWLNGGSSITYAPNLEINGKREVTLSGEAYFDVKHDADHPFIVHAGKLNIVVLGTAFDVKAYKGDTFLETTLIRGKVEIDNNDDPDSKIVLYPNEKVTMSTAAGVLKKTQLSVKRLAPDSLLVNAQQAVPQLPDAEIPETAWVNDKLSFSKTNFNDLARQLERWYNVRIVFDNQKYASKQFTGTFTDQDITEVMRDLQYTESFHYSINNNQIHIW